VEALISKARTLHHLERDEEAITYYDKALEKDPENIIAFCNKGRALECLGQPHLAVEYAFVRI
jgi:tetratricopeptide (TPR) repeat protein